MDHDPVMVFAGRHARSDNVKVHEHSCQELILINRGSCDVQFETGTKHIEAGDVLLVPAHSTHDQVSDEFVDTLFCGFDAEGYEPWDEPLVLHLTEPRLLHDCLNLLALKSSLQHHISDVATSALLSAILSQINVYLHEQHQHKMMPRLLTAATQFMKDHINEPLNVEQIAEHLKISASSLYILFRDHLRTSPMQYLRDQRMTAARTALHSPYLSVKEVAGMCGYPDVNHFVRTFRIEHGLPPGKWRQQL